MRILVVVLVAVTVFAVSGCGERSGGVSPGAPPSSDIDGSWVLASGHDVDGRELEVADRLVTLDVSVGDGEVSGVSGCNHYFAGITEDQGLIRLHGVGGTEMACEPAVMDLEQQYLSSLRGVDQAEREGGRLTLSGLGADLVFESRPPTTDADLVGTTWRLESLVDGDSVSSPSAPATLMLGADGTFEAWTGCSSLTGDYRLRESALAVSRVEERRPGSCAEQVSAQRRHLAEVLRGRLAVEVSGDRLTVMSPQGKGADFRAR